MNRDSFENQIGNSLREARVQVPAGAWQAIQAGLPKSSFVQPNNGINFWLSGITALVMLTGLSLYSEFHVDANHEKMALVEPETLGAEPVLDIMVKTVEVDSTEPQTENSNIASDEDNTPIHHASTTQISERTAEINIAEITPKTILVVSEPVTQPSPEKVTTIAVAPTAYEEVYMKPEAMIKVDRTQGYAPFTVKLANAGKASRNDWSWNASEKSGKEVNITFDSPGSYSVSLRAMNEQGTEAYDEVKIEVLEPSSFDVPNSFSPNGDGLNETFGVSRAINVESFTLFIVDNLGNVVFQSSNVNEKWTFNPSVIPSPESRLFVNYRAIGLDGVVHARVMVPLTVIR